MTNALRIVVGAEAGRADVLRRDPLLDAPLPEAIRRSIVETFGEPLTAGQVVARIIEDVRTQGDAAVRRYSQRFDGSADAPMEVTEAEFAAAEGEVDAALLEAVEVMTARIRAFHTVQREHAPRPFLQGGLGMEVRPIGRAGIYMTGNIAVLPSSVVHTAVPAVVAGVPEVVGVTAARPDGSVHPLKLVAARRAGVQRVFRASGAQALAALAFGTESIPACRKVLGPGSPPVASAQLEIQRHGVVGMQILAASESLVLADATADPVRLAADLLNEAEHGPDSEIGRAHV